MGRANRCDSRLLDVPGAALSANVFDIVSLAGRGRRYREMDQLVMELLLGLR